MQLMPLHWQPEGRREEKMAGTTDGSAAGRATAESGRREYSLPKYCRRSGESRFESNFDPSCGVQIILQPALPQIAVCRETSSQLHCAHTALRFDSFGCAVSMDQSSGSTPLALRLDVAAQPASIAQHSTSSAAGVPFSAAAAVSAPSNSVSDTGKACATSANHNQSTASGADSHATASKATAPEATDPTAFGSATTDQTMAQHTSQKLYALQY